MHTSFLPSDLKFVNKLLRGGSRSFYAASFMLPPHVRNPAKALYSFCRVADDEIDRSDNPTQALAQLKQRVDNIYADRDLNQVEDRALAAVVHSYNIPKDLILGLLDGFAWDTQGRRFNNLSELFGYSVRVAGSVGIMMSLIMGERSRKTLARANDLGVAMQLTNIARDIGEDARAGRLYLPLHWFKEFDIDPDQWLQNPTFDSRIAHMVKRLLNIADEFYSRADAGIAALPADCRNGIYAARLLYSEIGQELKRQGLDSVSKRAVVSRIQKFRLLPRLLGMKNFNQNDSKLDPIAESTFLIDVIESTHRLHTEINPLFEKHIPKIEKNATWVLDLFEKLEQRDRDKRLSTI